MDISQLSWMKIIGLLVGIGLVAMLIGWGARFLTTRSPKPELTVIPTPTLTPTQVKEQTPTEEAQSTMPGTDSESTSPPSTSTPRPTSTPSPTPATVIVGDGDGLYQICRDYCDGCWERYKIPSDLETYAQKVAEHNGKPWNYGKVPLVPSEELEMLPCPSHCP
jgi:hypothetical protein